jgi:hypothetical protein
MFNAHALTLARPADFEMPRPRTISTIRTALTRSRAAGLRTCTEGVSVRCAVLAIGAFYYLIALALYTHKGVLNPTHMACLFGYPDEPHI